MKSPIFLWNKDNMTQVACPVCDKEFILERANFWFNPNWGAEIISFKCSCPNCKLELFGFTFDEIWELENVDLSSTEKIKRFMNSLI